MNGERRDPGFEAGGEKMSRFLAEIERQSKCRREDLEGGKITKIETEKGEKFTLERLDNSQDPRVEGSHKLLAKTFGKSEVDSLDTIKTAMDSKVVGDETTPDDELIVTTVEDKEGKVVGTTHSAVLESIDENFQGKGKTFAIDAYTAITKEAQGGHVGLEMFRHRIAQLAEEARARGVSLEAMVAEVHKEAEGFYNKAGFKRLYFEGKDGIMKEVPYDSECLADAWDKKTGKPKPGEKPVPEHLMMAQLDGRKEITVEELLEKVRAMMNYNSYQTEGYFKGNEAAFNQHEKTLGNHLKKLERALSEAREGRIKLMSAEDRDALKMNGIEFFEHEAADKE